MNLVRRCLLVLVSALLFVTLGAASASASDNDFVLSRLCNGASCVGGIENFKTLSRNISSLLAPGHFMPANTLGLEGFEIGLESRFSFAADDASWKAFKYTTNHGIKPDGNGVYAAPDYFASIQMHLRKGLPMSLEFEGVLNWLVNSEMFYLGAGLRWAILDNIHWAVPDLSVRGHVGTLVGSTDMNLINVNLDVALSYTWGLGGVVALTPYAGYSLLFSIASSRAIFLGYNSKGQGIEDVFSQQTQLIHRAFVGIHLQADYFVAAIEGEFGDTKVAGVKIGANF